MDTEMNGKKEYSKIAKGKVPYQTQVPAELWEAVKAYSEETGTPVTILTEKIMSWGIRKAKETGALPMTPESEIWG